jgi:predicted HicB family RNase H-like nuclease
MILEKKNKKEIEDPIKIISKGGHVSEDLKSNKYSFKNINLRLPEDMFHAIDDYVEKRIGISRNGWILQCLDEKLKQG